MKSGLYIPAIALLVSWVTAVTCPAANVYWIGSGNWSDSAHWSTSSGGAGGETPPDTSDAAIFDAASTNCYVNQNVIVNGVQLTGYGGTVTVANAYAMEIRTTFSQDSGEILCGTNLLTFRNCNPTFSGGTFTHTNGTVMFYNVGGGGGFTITGNISLDNATFYTGGGGGSYPWIIAAGSTVTVARTTLFDGSGGRNRLNTGTLVAKGDIINVNNESQASATVLITGTNDQTLAGVYTAGGLPNIVIDKSGGILTLSGTNRTARNWTHLNGTVDAGTSMMIFHPSNANGPSITSTASTVYFHDVSFEAWEGGGASYPYTFRNDLTMVVSNDLRFGPGAGGGAIYGGTIEARGDIDVQRQYRNGTVLLLINGTVNQTLAGSTGLGFLPDLRIDKASGTLTLAGTNSLYKPWTHISGTVDPGTSHMTVYAANPAKVTFTSAVGRVNFYNVELRQAQGGGDTYFINIAADTTLVVTNTLSFSLTTIQGGRFTGGPVEIYGNITNGTTFAYRGTSLFRFKGDAAQTYYQRSPYSQIDHDFEIDKSGGEFTLANTLIMNGSDQDFVVTNGTLNLGTNILNVTGTGSDFLYAGTNTMLRLTLDGLETLITVDSDVTVNGTLSVIIADAFVPLYTNRITLISSGTAVSNTFVATICESKWLYEVLYNDGGNNVILTNFRPLSGTVITIR